MPFDTTGHDGTGDPYLELPIYTTTPKAHPVAGGRTAQLEFRNRDVDILHPKTAVKLTASLSLYDLVRGTWKITRQPLASPSPKF